MPRKATASMMKPTRKMYLMSPTTTPLSTIIPINVGKPNCVNDWMKINKNNNNMENLYVDAYRKIVFIASPLTSVTSFFSSFHHDSTFLPQK